MRAKMVESSVKWPSTSLERTTSSESSAIELFNTLGGIAQSWCSSA